MYRKEDNYEIIYRLYARGQPGRLALSAVTLLSTTNRSSARKISGKLRIWVQIMLGCR